MPQSPQGRPGGSVPKPRHDDAAAIGEQALYGELLIGEGGSRLADAVPEPGAIKF